jgi:hypothetical protein
MKKEKQRIALAKIDGWKIIPLRCEGDPPDTPFKTWEKSGKIGIPPDYLNDLNAMHELEKTLSPVLAEDYAFRLKTQDLIHDLCFFVIAHTTAPQRCEAILKTFDKWEESE